ncbi:MAG: excinuclease ABC subunit UvrC [Thermoplasmata archaeon]|nr:excinuclease ABC subunit UvrC [Thermoplasmata archaeon]
MSGTTPGPTGFVPASELRAADVDRFHPGPSTPGVYLFRSPRGEVVYVGKALRLRRRILDHLHARVEKDGSILAHSGSVEFVPTENEREALLLEASLIKQYQPPFNTLLKDDRSYPYLAVTVGEAFPRVLLVRRPRRSSRYLLFGPYTSAREARGVAQVLTETFRLRRCLRLPKVECLYYHIGACPAPCVGKIGIDEYRVQVDQAVHALKHHGEGLAPRLETEMKRAAGAEQFERAALLRDALDGFRALTQRQRVVGPGSGAQDFIALAYPNDPATLRVAVGLLHVVDGEVRGTEPHLLAVPPDDVPDPGELLRQFLTQYYGERVVVPDRIFVQGPRPTGVDDVVDWLEGERGIPIAFRPTGHTAALAGLAERLARATVDQVVVRAPPREVLVAVQRLLNLPTLPNRIEGIDISIFQGSEGVASLVVFERGAPAKSEYRRYRIRTVQGTNDFASIAEVVRRRFERRVEEGEPLPDLLLIDGGRGQLAAATEVLTSLHLDERIPSIGLAKREEEVYVPGRSEPLKPNPNAPPMLLLRAVRDEAHRFAVTYHRTRRRMRLREEFEDAGTTSRSSSVRSPR